MASAAPLKPLIGYQPTGAQDRWLSLWAWGYETPSAHTTVHVTPLPFTRSADDAVVLKMQLFDGKVSPIAVFQSEPLRLGQHLHIPLRDVLAPYGAAAFDGPAQIQASMLRDPKPSESRVIETWTTTYTDDGLMSVSYPSIGLAGLPSRSAQGGGVQYIAGLPANDRHESVLVVLNPYPRDFEVAVRLYRADGEYLRSEPRRIRQLTVLRDTLDSFIPGARGWLASSDGIGTVVTETTYKMVQYALIRDRETGRCAGMDHLLPIFP